MKLPPLDKDDLATTRHEPPPREGLLPGEYSFIDPARATGGLLDKPPLPEFWTADYAAERLIEAHDVLQRMPIETRPKGYGAAWPEYRQEWGDLVLQAGAGTLEIGRNRISRGATAGEVERMSEALAWPMRFFGDAPEAARDLNLWAMRPDETPRPDFLFQRLALRLNMAGVPIR